MVAHFDFQGALAATVEVNRGIRRRCTLSGTVFALVADPFVRWFQAQAMFMSANIFLFADDEAIVLAPILESLDGLAAGLQRWAAATGLRLKGPKCVFIPLWDG